MSEPQTVLAAAIVSTSATVCSVGDVLGFPAAGTFVVEVGTERMLIGAGAGTTSWSSITRGYQGTTAATHLIGAAVTLVSALDVTIGGASADSYLSVADADAQAADDIGPEAAKWLASSISDREKALKRATRDIDDYLVPFSTPYATTQRLFVPRAEDLDADDVSIIPARIARATYLQAIFVLSNAGVIDRANSRRARSASTASEPNMSYTVDEPQTVMSGRAIQALAGYGGAGRGRAMIVAQGTTGLTDPYWYGDILA